MVHFSLSSTLDRLRNIGMFSIKDRKVSLLEICHQQFVYKNIDQKRYDSSGDEELGLLFDHSQLAARL